MSKKISLKDRYFRFRRRFWPMLAFGAIILAPSAGSPHPATRVASPSSAIATPNASQPTADTGDDSREWPLRLPRTELYLAPEFRLDCSPFVSLPPSVMLNESDDVLDALEPIASCLTLGPMTRQSLQLITSAAAANTANCSAF